MQIPELRLSALKVERYATVRARMGNALSKTKQNPMQNQTTPRPSPNPSEPVLPSHACWAQKASCDKQKPWQ